MIRGQYLQDYLLRNPAKIIKLIYFHKLIRATKLYRLSGISYSQIYLILKFLVKNGFVDATPEFRKSVSLTNKGQKMAKFLVKITE